MYTYHVMSVCLSIYLSVCLCAYVSVTYTVYSSWLEMWSVLVRVSTGPQGVTWRANIGHYVVT